MPSSKKDQPPRISKAPDALVRLFAEALSSIPDATQRKMFGYPAAFLGGHMFTGLYRDQWIVRLGPADREEATRTAGARPFEPMPGRVMKEYVVLAEAVVVPWLEKARAFVAAKPPKVAPPRKRGGARS